MNYFVKYGIFVIASVSIGISSLSNVYADSDPYGNYTYIDCYNGVDNQAIPFDNTKPYLTLKKGIEQTIQYINDHQLTSINNTGALSKTYTIKVKGGCVFDSRDGASIALNFAGSENNSRLDILGDVGNFGVMNKYFNIMRQAVGNIYFENVSFLRNDVTGFYFSGFNVWRGDGYSGYISNGSGIKIKNALINISTGKQFMDYRQQTDPYYYWYNYYYNYFHPGGFFIENAMINLSINGNYNFMAPVIIKDAKIQVKNSNNDGVKFNVGFYIAGENRDGFNYGSTSFISSEIDLGGNNFLTDNNNANFVNDKFSNVGNFTLGTETTSNKNNVFINNLINSANNVDITHNDIVYNNLFSSGFTDSNDVDNFKRNFSGTNSTEKGIGWVYRKVTGGFLHTEVDYETLFTAVTGNTLPYVANPIYILIQ